MKNNIILVGPMGAGKSTIGRLISNELKIPFFDVDVEIETSTGASISWIFDKEGESGFRSREEKMTAQLCSKIPSVIATGGGVVLSEKNRFELKQNSFVIYLKAEVKTLLQRTAKDTKRPLLKSGDPKKILQKIIIEREPLYQEVADFIILTSNTSSKDMSKNIISLLKQQNII